MAAERVTLNGTRASRIKPARPHRLRFTPRVKIWLEIDGNYAFGHGIAEILQAVLDAGNIKQAAAALGRSYRYVWDRIKQAEAVLGCPLVEAHQGGTGTRRSFLTQEAQSLVAEYMTLRQSMTTLVQQEYGRLFG
jgi:molybdate transport system regulatory protein